MCSKVSAEFVLWLISFFGYMVQYMLLTNLNIAMTDMNQETRSNLSTKVNLTRDENDFEQEKKFSWNQSEEGLLLSGVFWLLWISHPVGGTLSHKFGAKIVVVLSILVSSCMCLLIPWAAFIHMRLLLIIRVIQGFILGLAFPSIMSVIQFWIAESETGKFLTCFLGISFGSAITYFISGFIIEAFTWEGIFYVTGIIGLLWCGAWWYLMYDKPELHPRLTEDEKKKIRIKTKNNFSMENLARQRHIPWSSILTSGRVYLNALSQFGMLWSLFTIIIYGPKYVKFFHHLNSVQTGVVSGVPHFIRVIFSIMYAAFTDKIVKNDIVSKTCARKIGTFVSHIIPGLALIMLALSGENLTTAILAIYLFIVLSGAVIGGTLAGMSDMSPNYSGIIMGLCGVLTHTTGLLSPLLVGYLTLNNDTIERWEYIFYINAAISIGTGLLFILFWSSDLQEWDGQYFKVPEQSRIALDTTVIDKRQINNI